MHLSKVVAQSLISIETLVSLAGIVITRKAIPKVAMRVRFSKPRPTNIYHSPQALTRMLKHEKEARVGIVLASFRAINACEVVSIRHCDVRVLVVRPLIRCVAG